MATRLLKDLLEAQSSNSSLSGDELSTAAHFVCALARRTGLQALASDRAGERILGAALMIEPGISMADRSRRFDGSGVLLVAGYISGDAMVATRARSVRSLGASRVEVVLLTPWSRPIADCDAVWRACDSWLKDASLAG